MENNQEGENFFQQQSLTENVANFFMCFKNIQNEPPKTVNNLDFIDSKALRMMSKMGYQSGTGLGRNNQGITEPIEVQNNLGRRGLGHIIENLEPCKETWDYSSEEIIIEEKVDWLQRNKDTIFNWTINSIIVENRITNETILHSTKYCDIKLVKDVFSAKEILDNIESLELCKARSRSNAFESIRSAFFMNRAALKMANIDVATNFLFSGVDRQVEHKQNEHPYYFADICAGPGGFSEYIFWRKKWAFKGFGLTLKGEHDFKLNASTCADSETFESLYGIREDGDIYFPENINDFCQKVKSCTDELGVHFVMADGGFSVENQENLQEVLSRQIYICQCLVALNILRPNGHFVVKLFDLFTPFSVGLIYLMYRCFEKVAILKPNSSRPANSERYLICSKLLVNDETVKIRKYIKNIVELLHEIRTNPLKNHLDINEIVPEQAFLCDNEFLTYIRNSNKRIAEKQLLALVKLAKFIRDPTLVEPKQDELRAHCLAYWQIPDKPRILTKGQLTVDELLTATIINTDFMCTFATPITSPKEFYKMLEDKENWHFSFATINEKINVNNIFASLGLNYVYRFDPVRQRWNRVKNLELVRGTILFGEIVNEYSETDDDRVQKCLHVIDALRLGDVSLIEFPYKERLELINIYCQAVNREYRTDLLNVRLKPVLPLSQLTGQFLPTVINNKYQVNLIPTNTRTINPYYCVNSILLLNTNSDQSFDETITSRRIIYLPNILTMKSQNVEQETQRYILWTFIGSIIKSLKS